MNVDRKSTEAVNRLREWHADFAIILGSGLSAIVPQEKTAGSFPYSDFSELPQTSVPGHAGKFVLGQFAQKRIIFAQGRVHLYEGFTGRQVTSTVRILAEAGVKTLIVTNAAGSTNPKFTAGTWMMITDHLNLTGTSSLLGSPNFVDLTEAYSIRLRNAFAHAAAENDLVLNQGVYAGLLGPQYETPAEVRMLQKLGADAVGMSTVLEVIQARALEMEVAGFSCLTNLGAGLSTTKLSHAEVLETGRDAATTFSRLLNAGLAKL